MARRIIGIVGIGGSGKTFVCQHLIDAHSFRRVSFMAPVKRMLHFGLGLTPAQVDGPHRETPDPVFYGKSGQDLSLSLINDWGRKQIGAGLWCNVWRRDALALDGDVVADDVRYSDEVAVIRALGGEIWKVYRPGLNSFGQGTENLPRGIEEDRLIANATSIADLIVSVDTLVKQVKGN